jgi:hypothetical protein
MTEAKMVTGTWGRTGCDGPSVMESGLVGC